MKSVTRRAVPPLLIFALLSSCVPPSRSSRDEPPPAFVATWDPPETSAGSVSLFPPKGGNPTRTRHHLVTESEVDALTARVAGDDPYYVFRLQKPERASSLRVAVDTEGGGRFQLFWTSAKCPNFSEACSVNQNLPAGSTGFAFFLDAREAVRDLRIDVPEKAGSRVTFRSLVLATGPEVDGAWSPREGTALDVGPLGFTLTAGTPDPWMTTITPGLDAAWVGSVEVVLRSASSRDMPQLFWDGPCGHFSEECSVMLGAADAGDVTHAASLRGHPRWAGPIGSLRFDPGPDAGVYSLERITLVRAPNAPPRP